MARHATLFLAILLLHGLRAVPLHDLGNRDLETQRRDVCEEAYKESATNGPRCKNPAWHAFLQEYLSWSPFAQIAPGPLNDQLNCVRAGQLNLDNAPPPMRRKYDWLQSILSAAPPAIKQFIADHAAYLEAAKSLKELENKREEIDADAKEREHMRKGDILAPSPVDEMYGREVLTELQEKKGSAKQKLAQSRKELELVRDLVDEMAVRTIWPELGNLLIPVLFDGLDEARRGAADLRALRERVHAAADKDSLLATGSARRGRRHHRLLVQYRQENQQLVEDAARREADGLARQMQVDVDAIRADVERIGSPL